MNPNEADVEINVRQTVFTPEKTGINYITVRGFTLRNAATPWAPPTAGQIGLVGRLLVQGLDHREQRDRATRAAPASRWASTATSGTTGAESAEGYVGTLTRAR